MSSSVLTPIGVTARVRPNQRYLSNRRGIVFKFILSDNLEEVLSTHLGANRNHQSPPDHELLAPRFGTRGPNRIRPNDASHVSGFG